MVSVLTSLQPTVSSGAVEEVRCEAYVHVYEIRSGARCDETSVQFGQNSVVFISHTAGNMDWKMSAELPRCGQHTAAESMKYWSRSNYVGASVAAFVATMKFAWVTIEQVNGGPFARTQCS